ncbi:MAG TPA: class I SAM-dependent methyltransferase [Dehalococcoidales bacterium]
MLKQKPWHENDDFWELWGPVMFNERRVADAPTEADNLISLLKIKPGNRVLDLCCGIGRHSLELARRGFKVTGVDRTADYLSAASKQAKKAGLDIEFVNEDMRSFRCPSTFNTAICMFTSFGFFEDPEDDRKVVLNMYQSLKKGGCFLIDVNGKERLAAIFRERDWRREDDAIILEERKVTQDWSWMEAHWTLIKDGKIRENTLTHRIYSAAELKALLTSCGFSEVKVYGDFAGSPYDQNAKRLVVVAKK